MKCSRLSAYIGQPLNSFNLMRSVHSISMSAFVVVVDAVDAVLSHTYSHSFTFLCVCLIAGSMRG